MKLEQIYKYTIIVVIPIINAFVDGLMVNFTDNSMTISLYFSSIDQIIFRCDETSFGWELCREYRTLVRVRYRLREYRRGSLDSRSRQMRVRARYRLLGKLRRSLWTLALSN